MSLQDIFRSVREENQAPKAAVVTGDVPGWLEGCLYRIGPSKFEFGNTQYNHWFDGMAMVYRFRISNGQVTYQNRFIQSESYRKNLEANRIVCTEFGTLAFPDPCKSRFSRFFSHFMPLDISDNTNVNIYPVGDALYATSETNYIRRIDPETLTTMERVDLQKVVTVHHATAHPHVEPDGTLHNLGSIHGCRSEYAFIEIRPQQKPSPEPAASNGTTAAGSDGKTEADRFCVSAKVVGTVPAQWRLHPSYYHSFGMTENYYVLVEQPVVINVLKLLSARARGVSWNTCMEWYPDSPVRFHVVDRKTGHKVNPHISYQSEAFFTFHHVNAYEEDGCIVLDLIAFPREAPVEKILRESLSLTMLRQSTISGEELAAYPRRYLLPVCLEANVSREMLVSRPDTTAKAILKRGGDRSDRRVEYIMWCTHDQLSDLCMELPTVHYAKVNTRKYRYCYGVAGSHFLNSSLVKLDVQTRETTRWQNEKGIPSEPVFVPRPGASEEDDGVILSVVVTMEDKTRAFLVALEAKRMTEIARATIATHMCLGFHGLYVPGSLA